MTARRLSRARLGRAAVIAAVGYPVVAMLGRTLRWHVHGYTHYEHIRSAGRHPIFAFWHGRIFSATWFWRGRDIVVMTSENFDGEWIARVIQKFGYGVARGSTSHGGRRALVQLRRDMCAGKPAAFTIDGPRGPARVAQPGAVWLASLTGNPILPFHIEAARFWELGNWDRTQIPRPFSPVAIAIGEPLTVPSKATETELETARQRIERVLGGLETHTREMLAAVERGPR